MTIPNLQPNILSTPNGMTLDELKHYFRIYVIV